MMMICRWITLTSQHLWQNHHIKQYFCQIRAWKKSVVRPVFQICLLYTWHTRDRQFEPIKLHYSKNVWSTRLSKFVIVCAFRSKNCGSPGFQTILKTGQTTLFFFMPLFGRNVALYGNFVNDAVTSDWVYPHTIISFSIHYVVNIITNKKLQFFLLKWNMKQNFKFYF